MRRSIPGEVGAPVAGPHSSDGEVIIALHVTKDHAMKPRRGAAA